MIADARLFGLIKDDTENELSVFDGLFPDLTIVG